MDIETEHANSDDLLVAMAAGFLKWVGGLAAAGFVYWLLFQALRALPIPPEVLTASLVPATLAISLTLVVGIAVWSRVRGPEVHR